MRTYTTADNSIFMPVIALKGGAQTNSSGTIRVLRQRVREALGSAFCHADTMRNFRFAWHDMGTEITLEFTASYGAPEEIRTPDPGFVVWFSLGHENFDNHPNSPLVTHLRT
jgi:hypothetical protein